MNTVLKFLLNVFELYILTKFFYKCIKFAVCNFSNQKRKKHTSYNGIASKLFKLLNTGIHFRLDALLKDQAEKHIIANSSNVIELRKFRKAK